MQYFHSILACLKPEEDNDGGTGGGVFCLKGDFSLLLLNSSIPLFGPVYSEIIKGHDGHSASQKLARSHFL